MKIKVKMAWAMAATAKRYCRMVDADPTMLTSVAVMRKKSATPKDKLRMILANRLGMTIFFHAWVSTVWKALTVEYTTVTKSTTTVRT